MIRKSLILIFLLGFVSKTYSQKLGIALEDKDFHSTLFDITAKFESVVLQDTGTFWSDNMKLSGIGFMKDVAYKLTIVFQKDTGSAQNLALFRVAKSKVKEDRLPLVTDVMNVEEIAMLSEESLNVKAPPGETYAYKSGGRTWTLIGIEPAAKKLSHKNSYMPTFYQERYATDDRAELIKSVLAIREIYRKKQK